MHYHPWGFLPLSQGICQPLFQELLLLLQPLSLLPFDLELLFEPQLLQKGQDHIRHKEQLCSTGLGLERSTRSTFQLMKGWAKAGVESKGARTEARREEQGLEKEAMELNPKGPSRNAGGVEPKKGGTDQQRGSSFETQKEGMESDIIKAVRVGGWRLAQNETDYINKCCGEEGKAVQKVKGFEVEAGSQLPAEGEKDKKMDVDRRRDRQAGWWYQLMQSSQVYIENSTEGSKFVKWEKRKKRSGTGEAEAGHEQSQPPPREGVVEGAEANDRGEAVRDLSSESCRADEIHNKGRLMRMGSIPESGLNEQRKTTEKEACMAVAPGGGQESTMWWSRLFGSGARNPAPADREDQGLVKSQKNR